MTIGGLSIISLVSFLYLAKTNQPGAFLPRHFTLLGAWSRMAALYPHAQQIEGERCHQANPSEHTLFIIIIFICIPSKSKEIIALAIATSILIGSLRRGTGIDSLPTNKHLVAIGLLSYSLYLWHWGVLAISRWTIGVHAWTIPIQVVAMGILYLASYKLIEQPLRIRQWSVKPLHTVFYGIGATSTAASFLALIGFNQAFYLFTGRKHPAIQEQSIAMTAPYRLSTKQGITTWKGEACVISQGTDIGKRINPFDCALGDINKANTRILIVGNSLSATLPSGFDKLVLNDGYSVVITSSFGSAPAPDLDAWSNIFQARSDYDWSTTFKDLSKILKSGDWVFLASDIAYFTPLQRGETDDVRLGKLQIALSNLSNNLSHRGVKLAMLHGIP